MKEHRACDKCEWLCDCRFRDNGKVEDCGIVIDYEMEKRFGRDKNEDSAHKESRLT